MTPNIVKILKKITDLEKKLAEARVKLEKFRNILKATNDAVNKSPATSQLREILSKNQDAFDSAQGDVISLQKQIAELVKQQIAEEAAEEALRAKRIKDGIDLAKKGKDAKNAGPIIRVASWVGQRLGISALGGGIVLTLGLGLGAWGVSELAGRMAADSSTKYGSKIADRQVKPGQVYTTGFPTPTPELKYYSTYRLVKTKINSHVADSRFAAEEEEVDGFQSSMDLTVEKPWYTSTTTLAVQAPTEVKGDVETFTVSAKLVSEWNLINSSSNVNIGINLIGRPKTNCLPEGMCDGGATLEPGTHSLSVDHSTEISFNSTSMVSKWQENGLNYRSFVIQFHTSVLQNVSNGSMTFIYQEEKPRNRGF